MPVANGVFLPISHKRIRGSQNLDASPTAVSLPSFLCAEMLRSIPDEEEEELDLLSA